jgi:transcriptional regulator with XRE-family HTH domain
MSDRRTMSTTLSSKIIEYLRQSGHTQAKIARMLGVSEPYISLVKARERSLTLDHVERLCEMLGMPLGAFFITVTGTGRPKNRKRDASFVKIMKLCDQARDAILQGYTRKRKAS